MFLAMMESLRKFMINFLLPVTEPLMKTFLDSVRVELLLNPTNKFSSSFVAF